jgi:hypothetical protein
LVDVAADIAEDGQSSRRDSRERVVHIRGASKPAARIDIEGAIHQLTQVIGQVRAHIF